MRGVPVAKQPSRGNDKRKCEQRKQEAAHAVHADIQPPAFSFRRKASFEPPLQQPGKPQASGEHGNLPQHAYFLHVCDQVTQQTSELGIGLHSET